ncbi:MAG: HXXEE domain-containing protein [Pseudomonadota bacterium]
MLDRLFSNWAYATPPIAVLLIGLYPFIGSAIAFPLFLSLPAYMVHQFEEHDDNRFALFLNAMMGADKKGLTAGNVWVINVIFVWFLLLGVFYLASLNLAWAVMAAYLLAINGALHVVWALMFRKYNPGLVTSILLFFPISVWIFSAIPAPVLIHVVSAILMVVLHAAIMITARRPA